MPFIDRTKAKGFLRGELSGRQVVYKIIDQQLTVTQWHSGSFELPSGSSETVDMNLITNCKVLMVESSVSATVTLSDSQKFLVDGFFFYHIWKNKDVLDFTITQTRGTTATVNWAAAE